MIEPSVQTDYLYSTNAAGAIDDMDLAYNPITMESDGIGVLVQMAKNGKIDPWNIDIVDITDKYLASLFEMKTQNLRLTGRTILFAAILLRLKSNVLEGIDAVQFESPQEEYNTDYDDDNLDNPEYNNINRSNIISIDEVLQRRSSIRLNRKRVVTLEDLIKQLEFYEELEKKRSLQNAHERAKRRVRSFAKFSADDIVNLAHEEYIERSVERLSENLTKIFETEEKVEIESLMLLGMNKITTYIALLFLAARSDFELTQDEFYGPLYVQVGAPYVPDVEMAGQSPVSITD